MANIARNAQVVRESIQTATPNARVVQLVRESIILRAVPANEDYWQNPVAPVPARMFVRLPLGDPEELPAAALVVGQPDEDFWINSAAPIPARLFQRLPLGDPEEIPAATLVGATPHQDEDLWINPVAPVPARLFQWLPLGDPEELPAASLAVGQPDEDYWINPVRPVALSFFQRLPSTDPEEIPAGSLRGATARIAQVVRESIQVFSPKARIVQVVREVILLQRVPPDEDFWINAVRPVPASLWQRLPLGDPEEIPAGHLIDGEPDEDFWHNETKPVVASLYQKLPYFWDDAPWQWIPPPKSYADRPSIQLHPHAKPLDFYTKPLTQPGRKSTAFTTLLTSARASRAFSIPLGSRTRAAKVFAFTMGGTITPGKAGGTLTITPFYGPTSDGVNLGPSIVQGYSANKFPIPWRLQGEIVFQHVELEVGASLLFLSGVFAMDDIVLTFGTPKPIAVDTSAVSASASGSLNFSASFAPSVLNVNPPIMRATYAFLRAI